MNQLRATRLSQPGRRRLDKLDRWLPKGSWKRRLTLGAGIPILALIFIVLIMDNVVMPDITRQGEEFTLPDFAGQRLLEAQIKLEELDLSYEIASEQFSPDAPQGTILSQYPIAGTKVKSGRAIKFVTSAGQKHVPIPDVTGQSVRQALLELEAAGLKLGEIAWAYSDTIPEKVVVFSYPSAEQKVPLGSEISLMVNHGRASNFTYVPNLIGLALEDAKDRLEEKELRIGIVRYRTDENFLPETVLEQSEPNGTEVDVGTEIDLVVSSTG
jgi:beta-lactam-binding protein with PASTA domain